MSNTHVQRIVNATLVASLAFTGSYVSAPAALADEALPTDATSQNSLASIIGATDKTSGVTIKQGEEFIQNKNFASVITSLKSGAETSGNESTSEPTNTPDTTPATIAEPTITLVADTFTYNGGQHRPEILEIKDPDGSIVPSTTYAVEYGTNTHASSDATANQNYVKVTFNGTGAYPAGHSVSTPITIKPKQVTVTASNKYKIVNEPDPAFTAEVDGTIDGEKDKIIYSFEERDPGETVGTYQIKPTGEVTQGDYTVSFINGTLKILSSTTTLVSSEDELRYALSSLAASNILLTNNITVSDKDLISNSHNVTIDLEGHTLDLGKNSSLVFNGGDIAISNGTISVATNSVATTAIKITAGSLKLGPNVTVESPSSAVAASGESMVTIDEATIKAGSSEHAALVAGDKSSIEAKDLTLTVTSDNLAISEGTDAAIILKSGNFYTLHKDAIEPYLRDGYTLAYVTSSGAYSPKKNLADEDHTEVTLSPGPYEYEGEDVEPTVTVTFDDEPVSDEDYDVTYIDNDKVGDATVTVTAKDDSDYTGSNSTTFEIVAGAIEVEDSEVTLSKDSFTYNGKEQAPTVKVTVNGETVSSKHYDIEYSDNTDAGTAKVEVTFDGEEYEGTITKEFTIEQKEVTVTPANKTKTAGDSDPTFTATVSGTLGSDTVKYKLSRDSGESAGTYTIKASGDSSQGNYKVTYKTGTLTIKAKSSTSSSSSSSSTSPSSTKSNTTTSTKTTTSSNNSGTSTKSSTNSNSSSSKNSSSTGSSIGASSTGSTGSKSTTGTGSSSATTNKTPTAATGSASTSTSAAASLSRQPTARTADPSFAGFGTLITGALATLGIGLRTKRHNAE